MRGILLIAISLACGPKRHDQPPPPAEPVSLVTSMVIVEACPDSKHLDARQATREIEELVGPCKKVPGGTAHFAATLLPGGSIELASPSGDPSEGIVPTCVVQNAGQIRHRIKLASACKFDVKLEQRRGPR